MKLILNEKRVVDEALKEGHIDVKKPTSTIRLLIKYYYGIGQDKEQVRDSIESFMKKNYKNFNEVKWQTTLDNMVRDLQNEKYDLFVLNDVKISNNELRTIQSINNNRLEKLAFVLLVYAKIYNQMNNNQSNWVNAELKDIFSDTKMAVGSIDQGKMIHKLKELDLVDVSKRVDCTNIKVLFADETDVDLVINDFRDFVYAYLKWCGERIGNCEVCSKLIRVNNNSNKYCKDCAKNMHNESKRNTWHKYKNKYTRQTENV